jgi:hypothetical protein
MISTSHFSQYLKLKARREKTDLIEEKKRYLYKIQSIIYKSRKSATPDTNESKKQKIKEPEPTPEIDQTPVETIQVEIEGLGSLEFPSLGGDDEISEKLPQVTPSWMKDKHKLNLTSVNFFPITRNLPG